MLALLLLGIGGAAAVYGRASRTAVRGPAGPPLLTVETRRDSGTAINPLLFGLGVDLPTATYVHDAPVCTPLAGVGSAVSLVRIGADLADDYDWPGDAYALPGRRPISASFGCSTPPHGAAATIQRVLDRVRALHAGAVVVLNGEIDDPQSAAALVRLIVRSYGLPFARGIYWEIGDAPATWQHFAVPLPDRRTGDRRACSPDQYAALVTGYAAAIGTALQSDRRHPARIVADEWIAFATDQSWTSVVTAVDTQYYPFNSPDAVPPSAGVVAASVGGWSGDVGADLDQRLFGLRANLAQYDRGKALQLFLGGWNLDASVQPSSPFYGSSAQAVFVARVLLHLARDGVALAAWAPPLYATSQAPLTSGGQATPGFRVFAALHALAGARLLPLRGANETRLDVLAARRTDGRIAVVLSNAAQRGTATARLRLHGIRASRVSAAIQTFAPATPGGATQQATLTPRDMRVSVPALGVVVVTLARV